MVYKLDQGAVSKKLYQEINREGAIHLTLVDPASQKLSRILEIVREASRAGSKAVMIGGSTGATGSLLDTVAKTIGEASPLPRILFPGGVGGITQYAEAIFFMSELNSLNPYFIIRAQAMGAPIIKKLGLEPIPLGYIVVSPGETVGWVGQAQLIPRDKPSLAASFALAGQYLGMHFIYLEAGSGARKPIPPEMVEKVRTCLDVPLIVGGGIRNGETAKKIVEAGADVIVTGNIHETTPNLRETMEDIVEGVRRGTNRKKQRFCGPSPGGDP